MRSRQLQLTDLLTVFSKYLKICINPLVFLKSKTRFVAYSKYVFALLFGVLLVIFISWKLRSRLSSNVFFCFVAQSLGEHVSQYSRDKLNSGYLRSNRVHVGELVVENKSVNYKSYTQKTRLTSFHVNN